jgi:hypothetical protein
LVQRHDPKHGAGSADLDDGSPCVVAHSSGSADEALVVHRHQCLLHSRAIVEESDVDPEEALYSSPTAAKHTTATTCARETEQASAAKGPAAEAAKAPGKVAAWVVDLEVRLALRSYRDSM